jgi:hypothetical protein
MYQTTCIFSKIDKMFCAEQEAEYQEGKLVPFYYSPDKKIKLFQGDSLSILKKAPDNCIDMIFADPPYFGNQSGLSFARERPTLIPQILPSPIAKHVGMNPQVLSYLLNG